MGYYQIKSEPTMFVMLSYSWLIPRAYTITSFGLTNAITLFTKSWNSIFMEISMICCWSHQHHFIFSKILLDNKLVLETFESIFFMLAHEVFVWWKEWLPLIHVHLVKVAAVNLRKLVLLPLESSQVSHAYVRSILWPGDLQPSFYMCP